MDYNAWLKLHDDGFEIHPKGMSYTFKPWVKSHTYPDAYKRWSPNYYII